MRTGQLVIPDGVTPAKELPALPTPTALTGMGDVVPVSIPAITDEQVAGIVGQSPVELVNTIRDLSISEQTVVDTFREAVKTASRALLAKELQEAESTTADAVSRTLHTVDAMHNVAAINTQLLSAITEVLRHHARLPIPVVAHLSALANKPWPTLSSPESGYMASALQATMTTLYGNRDHREAYLRDRGWATPTGALWRDPLTQGENDLDTAMSVQVQRDTAHFRHTIGVVQPTLNYGTAHVITEETKAQASA
jgi:hypothetical protein